MSKSKVLFILTGSIAAYKACAVISRLVQDGCEVQTVASPSALKFIGAATLEGLTGKKTGVDLWEEGRAMDHIQLSRWADYGIVCPASANTCAAAAAGFAGDLVGAILLAWSKDKPLHFFPAMNVEMYNNAVTQENLAKLSAWGFTVHPTGDGSLACGETGAGRLLEPEQILETLKSKKFGSMLITAGPTREPIDGIRFLSNVSTGQTAASLADQFSAIGWDVTYLHGAGAKLPARAARIIPFGSFAELDEELRRELGGNDYGAVVHAAAVSDYSIASVNGAPADADHKLNSAGQLSLGLKANHKILPRLKEYSRSKKIKVIGFKLTLNQDPSETTRIAQGLLGENIDAVVANDWSRVARDRRHHPGVLLKHGSEQPFADLFTLAKSIQILLHPGGK